MIYDLYFYIIIITSIILFIFRSNLLQHGRVPKNIKVEDTNQNKDKTIFNTPNVDVKYTEYIFGVKILSYLYFLFEKRILSLLEKRISKNHFISFYIVGSFFHFPNTSGYSLHLTRRTLECVIFRYNLSTMNISQYLLGLSYYVVISLHLRNKKLSPSILFLLLQFLQSFSHYKIFYKKSKSKDRLFLEKYMHYISEFLIYLYIYYKVKTHTTLLNVIWILLFSCITIFNREMGLETTSKTR